MGYLIVDFDFDCCDVWKYVNGFEEMMICIVVDFGLCVEWIEGFNGIWLCDVDFGDWKIGVVGVWISCWVMMYGFVFNVLMNMVYF